MSEPDDGDTFYDNIPPAENERCALYLDRLLELMHFPRAINAHQRMERWHQCKYILGAVIMHQEHGLGLERDTAGPEVLKNIYMESILNILEQSGPSHARTTNADFLEEIRVSTDYTEFFPNAFEAAVSQLKNEGRLIVRENVPERVIHVARQAREDAAYLRAKREAPEEQRKALCPSCKIRRDVQVQDNVETCAHCGDFIAMAQTIIEHARKDEDLEMTDDPPADVPADESGMDTSG